jgi:Flagellar biosynthesis protein, FliO
MLALLLSVALAAPPVTEAGTYDRLFAETEAVATAPVPVDEPGPSVPGWVVPVLLMSGCLGWLLWQRRKLSKPAVASPALRIIQRQSLGDRNSIVLVEVIEPSGETRRLLVGSGSAAPVLLADLGLAAMMEPAAEVPANVPHFVEERAPVKPEIKAESSLRAPSPKTAPESPRSRRAFEEEEEEEVLPPRRNKNIADEILAERSTPNRDFSRVLARIGDE